MRPLADQDHYEILEIPRGASPAAVERAYRLARSTFADDSLALYSVVDPRDAEAIRLRVEEAYQVLSDPAKRSDYDHGLAPEEAQPALTIEFDAEPARSEATPGAAPTLQDLDGRDTPERYDGAAFRAARIRRSLDYERIAAITKVNPRYLRYIEEENVEGLPARVYVRGFVEAFARVVGFEPGQAVRGYMDGVFDPPPPEPTRRSRFLGKN